MGKLRSECLKVKTNKEIVAVTIMSARQFIQFLFFEQMKKLNGLS